MSNEKDQLAKSGENEESGEGGGATNSSISSISPGMENTNVIPIGTWPPPELVLFRDQCKITLELMRKFFPSKPLKELLCQELKLKSKFDEDGALSLAEEIFDRAEIYLMTSESNSNWRELLKVIFENKYPNDEREVWFAGKLSHRRYVKRNISQDERDTFRVIRYEPIRDPKSPLCSKIAPALFYIDKEEAKPTPEVERFINGERKAVPQSSLYEPIVFNRPVYKIKTGWEPYNPKWLPRRIFAAELTCETPQHGLIEEFKNDLLDTFAWTDATAVGNYLGYLVQPKVHHLLLGQMPAYGFLGPTKSGKGYLSNALPSILYVCDGESSVYTKKIPNNTYELEVFLETAKNGLYICFDEVKNASDEELKLIDAACTMKKITVRKFRHGYLEIDNLFTFSLTAVHRTFSDETYGRLAVIKLNESRPEKIASFHQRWCKRGPEILRALFDAVNALEIDLNNLPKVADRRPGFGLMAYVIEHAFGIKPNYQIEASNNDILDDLCRMFEERPVLGDDKGRWKRYSPRMFTTYMAEKYDKRWNRSTAISAINTALGYLSTLSHPIFKDSGYPAESGRRYHIEIREEGEKTKRTYIYVQELDATATFSKKMRDGLGSYINQNPHLYIGDKMES